MASPDERLLDRLGKALEEANAIPRQLAAAQDVLLQAEQMHAVLREMKTQQDWNFIMSLFAFVFLILVMVRFLYLFARNWRRRKYN